MKSLLERKEQILRNLLSEAEWSFHHGKNHDMSPYGSETKYVCQHETGQFGSGTYFSTYNGPYEKRDDIKKYGKTHPNQTPEFIQIDDGIYRVDMNLYKNLYRVYSEKQGDILHTMCSYLNSFYERISGYGLGRYQPAMADFNNSRIYQIIAYNSDSLGLQCPSYKTLIRMAQNHAQSDKKQSFSTVFMERNGFNGVNVSGVDKFDTSRHGSVIYDLSKTSLEEVPRGKTGWLHDVGGHHTNTIATKSWDLKDMTMINSLNGKFLSLGWDDMTPQEQFRIVKNIFNSPLSKYQADTLNSLLYNLRGNDRLMNYVFKQMFDPWKVDEDIVLDSKIEDEIVKHKQYYFINYEPRSNYYGCEHPNFFIKFLSDYKWNHWGANKEELQTFLNELMGYLKRPLTDDEQEYIREIYFDEEYLNEEVDFSNFIKRDNEINDIILQQSFKEFKKSGLKLNDYLFQKVLKNIPHPYVSYAIVDGNVSHSPLYFEKKNLMYRKYKELLGSNIFFPNSAYDYGYMKPYMIDLRDFNNPKLIYNNK